MCVGKTVSIYEGDFFHQIHENAAFLWSYCYSIFAFASGYAAAIILK